MSSHQTMVYPGYIFEESERLVNWGKKTLNGQHESSVSGTEIHIFFKIMFSLCFSIMKGRVSLVNPAF